MSLLDSPRSLSNKTFFHRQPQLILSLAASCAGFRRLLDAGGGLWVWIGCGLARHSVHGSQELICDPSCLPQSTQQSAVNRSGVVSNGVFTREEQTWNRLQNTHTQSA